MALSKNSETALRIVQMQFAKTSSIKTCTANSDQSVTITFEDGYNWSNFEHTLDTIKFSDDDDFVNAGLLFNQKLLISFAGDDLEAQSEIINLLYEYLIIKITYHNGAEKLIGSLKQPVIVNRKFSSQGFTTKRNFTFTCKALYPARFISV